MATKFQTGIDLRGQRAQNAADASVPTDLTTLQQVLNISDGLRDLKDPVKGTTTSNLALTALVNGLSHDGVTYATGDRILLKNQTDATQNGIYVIVASGTAARATDSDSNVDITQGFATTVLQGTTKGTGTTTTNPITYVLSTLGTITLGTTALNFAPTGASGLVYTAGAGLTQVGMEFRVNPGNGILADGSSTRVDPNVVVRKYAANCVATTNPQTFTHSLGTDDVTVAVYEGNELVYPGVTKGSGTVIVDWGSAPSASQYRVVVHG